MCPHTTTCVHILLCMCPRTTVYVSSYYCMHFCKDISSGPRTSPIFLNRLYISYIYVLVIYISNIYNLYIYMNIHTHIHIAKPHVALTSSLSLLLSLLLHLLAFLVKKFKNCCRIDRLFVSFTPSIERCLFYAVY
jgi:hypothetical protein